MNDAKKLLHDRKIRGLHISFGDGSEIGVSKEGRFLSVGVSLCGKDARKANEVIHLFTAHQARILARTPAIVIDGKTRRVFLLRILNRAHFLAAIKGLRAWARNGSTWQVGATEPIIIWEPFQKKKDR
jgi:hypothetical protein